MDDFKEFKTVLYCFLCPTVTFCFLNAELVFDDGAWLASGIGFEMSTSDGLLPRIASFSKTL